MDKEVLLKLIRCGETSRVQFKERFTTPKQMAGEMVAFANGEGGDILFGIRDKTGEVVGLDYEDVQFITRELGNSFARNPLIANFCAKMMPYRGLGSGIPRVLAENCKIEFYDDKAGNQFTASVSRITANKTANKQDVTANKQETTANEDINTANKQEITANKGDITQLQQRLLLYLKDNPNAVSGDLENKIEGATKQNIRYALDKLRELGLLKRIGSKKYGTWEVCNKEYTVKEN